MNTEELNAPCEGSVPDCAKNPLDVIRDNISDAVKEEPQKKKQDHPFKEWFDELLKEERNPVKPKLVFENSFTDDVPDLTEAHKKALDVQFEDLGIDSELVYLATSKKTHKKHTPEELREIDDYCLSQCERKNLSWIYSDRDLLTMAGVPMPCDQEIVEDFRQSLLVYVAKNGLPANIDLSLKRTNLTINDVPTKITSKSVEMAFVGLAELMSSDEAIELVGNIIGEKLKKVF